MFVEKMREWVYFGKVKNWEELRYLRTNTQLIINVAPIAYSAETDLFLGRYRRNVIIIGLENNKSHGHTALRVTPSPFNAYTEEGTIGRDDLNTILSVKAPRSELSHSRRRAKQAQDRARGGNRF